MNSVQSVNRLQQISSPAVPAIDDSVEAQFVHVPGGGAFVPHEVEGTSHVGVAVVTKQIVLGSRDIDHINSTQNNWRMEFLKKADSEADSGYILRTASYNYDSHSSLSPSLPFSLLFSMPLSAVF